MKRKNPCEAIIDDLGGSALVAHHTGRHQYTVERWLENGIPVEIWSVLIEASKGSLNPAILHEANETLRKSS